MAMVSPRVIASPDCADGPDSAATSPSFTGSAALAPSAVKDSVTAAASVSALIKAILTLD